MSYIGITMSHFLFIQSQDPFTEVATSRQYQLAAELAKAGNQVQVLLVQNGVTPARKGANSARSSPRTWRPNWAYPSRR